MAMIYDYQQKLELDVMKQMADEAAEKAVKTGENPAEAIGKAMAEYYAMFNDKKDTLVVTRKQTRIEDVDLYSENISRKTRREKRRSRNGYTVGQYRRKPERKVKNHDKWAEKKNAQKDTCLRLSDRLMGWCFDKDVKKVSAKEEEEEARKNAEYDLTKQQMHYNGAFFRDLVKSRDLTEDKIFELHYMVFSYAFDEQEVQTNIANLEEQIALLQNQLANMKLHKQDLCKKRNHAEKSLKDAECLYDLYDEVIKDLVLGIED